ncbi:hypothetical protein [Celeribacter arenosi]|uniref:Uncharacterized protein n=1 Tax=Celeribacter arenosi TaxID=792649 RepID=A0ABP7K779_9RHOB
MTGASDEPKLWQGELYSVVKEELLSLVTTSLSDKEARRHTLAALVPTRTYGDGTDTYEDFIRPEHAATSEQAAAAKELYWLRVSLGEITSERPTDETTFFADAEGAARAYLREQGIDFMDEQTTIVFWSPRRQRYVTIDLDFYQNLLMRARREIGFIFGRMLRFEPGYTGDGLPPAYHPVVTAAQRARAEAWLNKYPWRNGTYSLGG